MALYIDGELMPSPKHNGVQCSDEKVWSANTGRAKSALMNGTIVQLKKTRSFTFPPLTKGQLDILNSKINEKKEWHTLKYTDTSGNVIFDFTCYFGTPSYSVYSAAKDLRYFCDYKFNAIER